MTADNRRRRTRYIAATAGLGVILVLLVLLNLKLGSTDISLREVLDVLGRGLSGSGGDSAGSAGAIGAIEGSGADDGITNGISYDIIWNIRLPRILTGVMLGGALAISGYLLQVFFANPIAGPYVLGISSGAKLTVALSMVFLLQQGITMSALGMTAAAFAGSLIAMGFVLALSGRIRNMSMLVVVGVMIGYICSAITDFVVTFADDSNIVNLHNWSLGSLSGMEWDGVGLSSLLVCIGVVLAFLLSKPISAYRLGEAYAVSLGVNIRRLRIALILISSLLSGVVTAFAGPISFVGIAVPHLMRSLIRSDAPIRMIPACFLGGASVTLLCDGIARTIFAPTELSISSVTAVFLVPVVLYMMVSRGRERDSRSN